ncbi:unnamed protein product, partial [Prunus brigantina]
HVSGSLNSLSLLPLLPSQCFAGLLPPLLPIAGASPNFCHHSARLLTEFCRSTPSFTPCSCPMCYEDLDVTDSSFLP